MARHAILRPSSDAGFTLVELLVVILIIGVLAAIAIPSFLNERTKGHDAAAKTAVRTAQTAIETYATDHEGAYDGADPVALRAIEPVLGDSPADSLTVSADADGYELSVVSDPGARVFTIERTDDGAVDRTCTVPAGVDRGGCPVGDDW